MKSKKNNTTIKKLNTNNHEIDITQKNFISSMHFEEFGGAHTNMKLMSTSTNNHNLRIKAISDYLICTENPRICKTGYLVRQCNFFTIVTCETAN